MSTMLQHCADVPDEWWQSTEVAYHNVFGKGHMTWEWNSELRSYVYPLPFDLAFRILSALGIDSAFTVWLVPKMIASAIATCIDVQTYRLGQRLDVAMGLDPRDAVAAKGLTVAKMSFVFSMLHWFTGYIGVRTQSNVFEALLTITAILQSNFLSFLFFAGCGCALRMTCAVPLTPFALQMVWRTVRNRGLNGLIKCIIELVIMLSFWLILSMSIDFLIYDKLTLTPLNFILFNVVKGHSAIFGTHPWHWYFSTAFPVVSLPFTVIHPLLCTRALWQRVRSRAAFSQIVLYTFAIVFTMAVYSFVPHKELRFFYPVVPLMIVISAFVFLNHPWLRFAPTSPKKDDADTASSPSKWLFLFFAVVNIGIYLVVSVGYRRGTIDVMTEIRKADIIGNSSRPIQSVHILTGCYATPGYSYVHGRVDELRTIDCTPNVTNEETSETAPTERDLLTENPVAFTQWVYNGIAPVNDPILAEKLALVVPRGSSWALPEVVVAYTYLANEIRQTFLDRHDYTLHKTLYHTFAVFQPHEDYTIDIWKRRSAPRKA